jgi:putative membrane protein
MKLILKILAVAGAMLLASHFVTGVTVEAFWPTAIIAALVFGVLNLTLGPILKLLTLPINFLTLGLFVFVINALLFWLLDFLDGVVVEGFVAALLGSLVISIVKWIVDLFME